MYGLPTDPVARVELLVDDIKREAGALGHELETVTDGPITVVHGPPGWLPSDSRYFHRLSASSAASTATSPYVLAAATADTLVIAWYPEARLKIIKSGTRSADVEAALTELALASGEAIGIT